MVKRLLITEEALRNRDGHWYEYNRATKAALLASDSTMQIDMIGHQSMEDCVARDLPAMPYFRYTVWDQIYNQPEAWKRYLGIVQHNQRLYRDLAKYLRGHTRYDVVFAPTVVLHHLMGYHAIAKRFAGKKCGQLIMLVRNNIATYDEDGKRCFRSTAKFWRWAIQRFKPFLNAGTVRFVTDSERLADEYEALSGIRFGVLPHPSLIGLESSKSDAVSETQRGASKPIRIFLPGPARYEKGADLLVEAAQLLADRGQSPPLEFCFQWSESFVTSEGGHWGPNELDLLELCNVCFDVITRPLSSEEYRQQLLQADLIILPYRRESYFARISGVAVEAMLMGKPLLYTSNTWVETVANQFGVGVAMEPNAKDIAAAIEGAVRTLPTLVTKSTEARLDVADFFSSDNFSCALLGQLLS